MQFDKGQIPPVQAFWSFTAYDKDGCFIANPLNRYAMARSLSIAKARHRNWTANPIGLPQGTAL